MDGGGPLDCSCAVLVVCVGVRDGFLERISGGFGDLIVLSQQVCDSVSHDWVPWCVFVCRMASTSH
jgi:hypothetical protein